MRNFQNLNAKVVLRCDLAVLFVPIALYGFTYGRFRLLPTAKTVVTSALTALGAMVPFFLTAIAVTVPLDSLLWGRVLWPEGIVFFFNTVQNGSAAYGVCLQSFMRDEADRSVPLVLHQRSSPRSLSRPPSSPRWPTLATSTGLKVS